MNSVDKVEALTGCYIALEMFETFFEEYREFLKTNPHPLLSKGQKQRFYMIDGEYKRLKQDLKKLSMGQELSFGFTADYYKQLMLTISRNSNGNFELPNQVLTYVESLNPEVKDEV